MTQIQMIRLIADEGKVITDGTIQTPCIDIFAVNLDKWYEIDAPADGMEMIG